jgi:hypothetical protein
LRQRRIGLAWSGWRPPTARCFPIARLFIFFLVYYYYYFFGFVKSREKKIYYIPHSQYSSAWLWAAFLWAAFLICLFVCRGWGARPPPRFPAAAPLFSSARVIIPVETKKR